MKLAIIGCGLIGARRAEQRGGNQVTVVVDIDEARAAKVAAQAESAWTADWREAVTRSDVDVVVIATTPDTMPEIAAAALKNGKHVFLDKPAARSVAELRPIVKIATERNLQVRVGFNHRFHPAMQRAHQIVSNGEIGELLYIRGRYGHGGRLGYEKEWRADRTIGGGGELVDQGMHLIDLSRWFLGDFTKISGHVDTYFWNMDVEDNAFMSLRTQAGQTAWLHASWTEWKNLFCFEIFGRTGKLQIDGLGGSYGVETLTFYRMKPELGPPDVQRWEFDQPDRTWQQEIEEFVRDIENGQPTVPNVNDAIAAHEIVAAIYQQSQLSKMVPAHR